MKVRNHRAEKDRRVRDFCFQGNFLSCSLPFGDLWRQEKVNVANLDPAGGYNLEYLIWLKNEWAWRYQLFFFFPSR